MKRYLIIILLISIVVLSVACKNGLGDTGSTKNPLSDLNKSVSLLNKEGEDNTSWAKEFKGRDSDSRLTNYYSNPKSYYRVKLPSWGYGATKDSDRTISVTRGTGVEGDKAEIYFSAYYEDEDVDFSDVNKCDITRIKSSTDIVENMMFKVEETLGFVEIDKFDYAYEASTVINGVDMSKFKGTLYTSFSVGDKYAEYKNEIVGYAIMGSERPFLMWIVDSSEDQNQDEELSEMADIIVQSFEDAADYWRQETGEEWLNRQTEQDKK